VKAQLLPEPLSEDLSGVTGLGAALGPEVLELFHVLIPTATTIGLFIDSNAGVWSPAAYEVGATVPAGTVTPVPEPNLPEPNQTADLTLPRDKKGPSGSPLPLLFGAANATPIRPAGPASCLNTRRLLYSTQEALCRAGAPLARNAALTAAPNDSRSRTSEMGVWLAAHLVRDEGVAGSNPATPTTT
jgi:hypothetical protein